jgi:hypothetical protein
VAGPRSEKLLYLCCNPPTGTAKNKPSSIKEGHDPVQDNEIKLAERGLEPPRHYGHYTLNPIWTSFWLYWTRSGWDSGPRARRQACRPFGGRDRLGQVTEIAGPPVISIRLYGRRSAKMVCVFRRHRTNGSEPASRFTPRLVPTMRTAR